MIRFIYADDLGTAPQLADTMFCDRATQFRDRLKWDVTVDQNGWEQDDYDRINPMYVAWEMPDGSHGGSMRILPTSGQTMLNDVFSNLIGDAEICHPLIWECTRFCISPRHEASAGKIAGALLLAGCDMGVRFGLTHAAGVFDRRMVRIYRALGWTPEILGASGNGADEICVGLWTINEEARARIIRRSGYSLETAKAWFEASFPEMREDPVPVTA